MANTCYLQLYLDTDYILPIAVGADGNVVKYQDQQGERRLYLYFSRGASGSAYEAGKAQKANYEARMDNCYGDFWNHLEKGDNVGTEVFTYIHLLDVANVYARLSDWFKARLNTETPDVVLNFSTIIGVKARRAFTDYLLKKGLHVRSYGIEVNDLLADKVVYDHRTTLKPVFGDQMLVLQSAGDQLLLSSLTWCGDYFMQGDKATELQKQGDDFKKRELATMVVNQQEEYYKMLLPSQFEAEIAYQMQFTEKWLANGNDREIKVNDFHYKDSPTTIRGIVRIDAQQLALRVDENSRMTINEIGRFYYERVVKNHLRNLHTIFLGDVFADERFRRHCIDVTESDNKQTFFTDNALQDALGRYYANYRDVEEPVADLESRYYKKDDERTRIQVFVRNANILGSLRQAIEGSSKALQTAIKHLEDSRSTLEEQWKTHMEKSEFDKAYQCLGGMAESPELSEALHQTFEALKDYEVQVSVLDELRQADQPHVREVMAQLDQSHQALEELQASAKALEEHPNHLRERTKYYEGNYETYKEYKKRLDREPSLGGKRRILKEMEDKDLTMEPLPQVDVETVSVDLACKVEEKRSGFLGMKKEKMLHITLQVKDGAALPFPCVLQITDSQQGELCLDGWYAELDEGQDHFEKTIPFTELPQNVRSHYVAQVFPDERHSHLTNSVYCPSARFSAK